MWLPSNIAHSILSVKMIAECIFLKTSSHIDMFDGYLTQHHLARVDF